MIEYCIRLSENEEVFYYSVRHGGMVLETEEVRTPGVSEQDAEYEFEGGSLAMD